MKIFLFLLMVTAAFAAVFFVGPRLRQARREGKPVGGEMMTSADLAYYDGKEGRPAYIAYDGAIYDVSKSGIWLDGIHFFRHPAGNDLTRFLDQAPHGEDTVLKMPQVATLVTENEQLETKRMRRMFYSLAYFNLTMVFVILLILALWRWWI